MRSALFGARQNSTPPERHTIKARSIRESLVKEAAVFKQSMENQEHKALTEQKHRFLRRKKEQTIISKGMQKLFLRPNPVSIIIGVSE